MEEDENEAKSKTISIKCGLQASLRVPELLPLIERGVKFVSEISVRGSRLVNGFLIAANLEALPSLANKTSSKLWIYQTLKLGIGSRSPRAPVPGLLEWYAANKEFYEPAPTDLPPQWKEIADYACGTYLTVFLNNLWMNYESRLRKFLCALYGPASGGVNDEGTAFGMVGEAETLCHLIIRSYDSGYNHDRAHIAPTLEQTQLVNEQRALFGLEDVWGPRGCLTEGRLKNHLDALLSTSIAFLRVVEEHNASIPPRFSKYLIKGWTIAPLCTRKRHNMTIDSEILMQMLKEAKQIKSDMSSSDFWTLAPDQFDSVFQVRRPADENQRRRKSHGPSKQLVPRCYVQTDGVVLNAQFQPRTQERVKGGNRALKKRKAEDEKENKQNGNGEGSGKMSAKGKRAKAKRDEWVYKGGFYDDQILIGIDPGRVNIMHAYRHIDGKTFQLTSGRFQEEGGVRRSRNKWLKWNAPLRGIYSQIGENSPKTASPQRWSNFIAVDTAAAVQIWSVNYSKQASRMRFHTHCKTKHVMEKFVAGFGKGLGLKNDEPKMRLVVGYGHARFAPSGRGEMAVPTTQSFKTVAKMWKTLIINENCSTIVCADCHGRLKKVKTRVMAKDRNGRSYMKDNRGVHRCTSECKTRGNPLKHRDKNASRNITEILRAVIDGNERPVRFTRAGVPSR